MSTNFPRWIALFAALGGILVASPCACADPLAWKLPLPKQPDIGSPASIAFDPSDRSRASVVILSHPRGDVLTQRPDQGSRIYRYYLSSGEVEPLAGNGGNCNDTPCDDGKPATDARVASWASRVAVAPNGDIYFQEGASAVRVIDKKTAKLGTVLVDGQPVRLKNKKGSVRIQTETITVAHGKLLVLGLDMDSLRRPHDTHVWCLSKGDDGVWEADTLAGGGPREPAVDRAAFAIGLRAQFLLFETSDGFGTADVDANFIKFAPKDDSSFAVTLVATPDFPVDPLVDAELDGAIEDSDGRVLTAISFTQLLGTDPKFGLAALDRAGIQYSAVTPPADDLRSKADPHLAPLSKAHIYNPQMTRIPGVGVLTTDNEYSLRLIADTPRSDRIANLVTHALKMSKATETTLDILTLRDIKSRPTSGSRRFFNEMPLHGTYLDQLPREVVSLVKQWRSADEFEEDIDAMFARSALPAIQEKLGWNLDAFVANYPLPDPGSK